MFTEGLVRTDLARKQYTKAEKTLEKAMKTAKGDYALFLNQWCTSIYADQREALQKKQ